MTERDTQEKITFNINIMELAKIDYLIAKGFYSNRSDFLRTALRNQLTTHSAFVSDEEVEQIVNFCANQTEQRFEESIQKVIESGGSDGDGGGEEVSDADEEALERCMEVLRAEGKASTSLLQRRLRLGYTRAARMIDILEARGIVGPADGAKPREVLIPDAGAE